MNIGGDDQGNTHSTKVRLCAHRQDRAAAHPGGRQNRHSINQLRTGAMPTKTDCGGVQHPREKSHPGRPETVADHWQRTGTQSADGDEMERCRRRHWSGGEVACGEAVGTGGLKGAGHLRASSPRPGRAFATAAAGGEPVPPSVPVPASVLSVAAPAAVPGGPVRRRAVDEVLLHR